MHAEERDRLVAKYVRILDMHNRFRMHVSTVTRLPGAALALDVVCARITALDSMRIAA